MKFLYTFREEILNSDVIKSSRRTLRDTWIFFYFFTFYCNVHIFYRNDRTGYEKGSFFFFLQKKIEIEMEKKDKKLENNFSLMMAR